MTLRTIVRDGLVAVNTHGQIPDGTPVEIVRLDKPEKIPAKKKLAKKSLSKRPKISKKKQDPFDQFYGMWKDRADWKGRSTEKIAQELREQASSRKRNG